jgi:3-methylcrotonyl-CoA carboxylase alpha subunit
MQVFADNHRNAVHLFERDCSLQRRHQKVIEEAPAPGMPPAMRSVMGEAAVKAAKAVDYSGAGTVEFIADASEGLQADRFWFMEMNTRLQVEHPVTEAITGLDLVEWQLRVAAGEKLPLAQNEIRLNGHAVEARLYAEDPQHDFLPSTGMLERLHLPKSVRVDSGVREGDAVTPFYDPMIAKVIAHAESREAAAAKLAHALEETQIAGLRTNTAFLIRALKDPDFVAGDIDTGFIPRHQAALLPPRSEPSLHLLGQAALFLVQERERAHHSNDPWDRDDGFRLAGDARETVEFVVGGKRRPVQLIHHHDGGLELAGRRTGVATYKNAVRLKSGDIAVFDHGETWTLPLYDPFAAADEHGSAAADRVTAPMPGKVIQVLVREGETVKRGQPLAVLEAMKMEHTLSASADASVAAVEVSPGDQVNEGAVVVRFAKEKSEAA